MSSETPNVRIENPRIRKGLGIALYILSLLAGLSTLFLASFGDLLPDLANDLTARGVAFVTAAVSLLSGAFGLVITVPNIPETGPQPPFADGEGLFE